MPSRAESTRRYLALARAVLRARRRAWAPFKLTWILTEACSLRCRTCHLWAGSPHAGPDRDQVHRVLDANPWLPWLNLSGGDLVERPDAPALLADVAERARDLALLDFPTAGQDEHATLAALEPLLDSPIPRIYVSVSLDGPDALHDRLRGRPGAAARARRTYRRLLSIRRKGFTVAVGMTLSRFNLPAEARAVTADLLPPGVPARQLHLNLAHRSTHYYRNGRDVAPPAASAGRLLALAQRRRGLDLSPLAWMERRYGRHAAAYLATGRSPVRCGALRAAVFLSADLQVYPCSIFDAPLGNLADVDHDLTRLDELPAARASLEQVEQDHCPGCWSPCEAFPTLLLRAGSRR